PLQYCPSVWGMILMVLEKLQVGHHPFFLRERLAALCLHFCPEFLTMHYMIFLGELKKVGIAKHLADQRLRMLRYFGGLYCLSHFQDFSWRSAPFTKQFLRLCRGGLLVLMVAVQVTYVMEPRSDQCRLSFILRESSIASHNLHGLDDIRGMLQVVVCQRVKHCIVECLFGENPRLFN